MTIASSPPFSISRVQASTFCRADASACLLAAHVMDERTAAGFALRHHHLDAEAGEQRDRRIVDAGVEHGLRAAGQQRDALLARAGGGVHAVARSSASAPAPYQARASAWPKAVSAPARDSKNFDERPRRAAPASAPRGTAPGSAARRRASRGSSGRREAACRSSRYAHAHGRRDACSARRTGRWSCRRGRTGSGRYG